MYQNLILKFGIILKEKLKICDKGDKLYLTYDIKIKPEKGKVLLFPGNYLFPHKGNMPISNSKYIATSWVEFKEMPAKLMRLHGKW